MTRCKFMLAVAVVGALIAGCDSVPNGVNPAGTDANVGAGAVNAGATDPAASTDAGGQDGGNNGAGASSNGTAAAGDSHAGDVADVGGNAGEAQLPPPSVDPWNQAGGGPGGSGVINISTKIAKHDNQIVFALLRGKPLYASPAIGKDGTIVIVQNDGTIESRTRTAHVNWQRTMFPTSRVESTPAIDDNGNIFIVETHHINGTPSDPNIVSTLNKFSKTGDWLGSVAVDNSTTLSNASPKIFQGFVILTTITELQVFDTNLNLFHNAAGALMRGASICAFSNGFATTSMFNDCGLSYPPSCAFGRVSTPLHPAIPSAAIAAGPSVTNRNNGAPMIIATSGFMLEGYLLQGGILQPVWNRPISYYNPFEDCPEEQNFLSSPSILHDSQVVIGDEYGSVKSFDVLTGAPVWARQIDGEVFTTAPVCVGNNVFIAGRQRLYMMSEQAADVWSVPLAGATFAQPAASSDHIYVSTTAGLETFLADTTPVWVDTDAPGGNSTPAIAADGTVYFVDSNELLHGYGEPPATGGNHGGVGGVGNAGATAAQ